MCQDSSEEVDSAEEPKLRRIARIQRLNFHLFWVAMVLVFGGVALAIVGGEWALYVAGGGFVVGGVVLFQAYLVYPFLRCPRCRHRFFLPDGAVAIFARINAAQKECRHCGLSLRHITRRST